MGTAMTCDENCFAFEMVHCPDDDPSLNNKIDRSGEVFDVNDDKHTGEEYAKNAPVLATEHKELEFPVMDVLKDGSKAHDKIEAAEMTCDNNDFEVERVTHPDDNSALNDTIIRRCEVADTTTEDATNNKLTGEEYAQNAALATEYKELEFPMTGALKKGSKVLDKVETVTHSKDNSALNDTIIKGCELVDTTIKDATNNKAVILDQNDFDFEMVNHTEVEADSTFNNTITSSYKLLDTTIEDAIDNKKSLASTIDLVISLMREVESKEKTAEQAKEDSARSGLDILAKVDELQQAHQHAKETNDTLARRVSAKKAILITDVKDLQSCVSGLLNEGGKLLGVLDEIRKALEMRLASAIKEKELADKAKLEKESLAQKSLSYEESQMIKVVEESERLTQEAEKISKLQEFLIDRRQVVDMLLKDISDKCLHVNSLKELLNQEVMQSGLFSSSQLSSILASIMPSYEQQLKKDELTETQKDWVEPPNSSVFSDCVDEHVPLTNQKQIKNGKRVSVDFPGNEMLPEIPVLDTEKMEGNKNGSSETDITNEPAAADITVLGCSMATKDLVVTAETNAERVVLRSIMPKDHGKKSRGKKRKFRKMSGWGTVPRRIGCAGDPRGYF